MAASMLRPTLSLRSPGIHIQDTRAAFIATDITCKALSLLTSSLDAIQVPVFQMPEVHENTAAV